MAVPVEMCQAEQISRNDFDCLLVQMVCHCIFNSAHVNFLPTLPSQTNLGKLPSGDADVALMHYVIMDENVREMRRGLDW